MARSSNPCFRCSLARWTSGLGLAGWVAALCLAAVDGKAIEPPERFGDIPSDSIAVASIDLAALRDKPEMKLVPWEIADVACREQLGFSLSNVESIDVTLGMPSPMPEFGCSIRFANAADIGDLSDEMATPVEVAPKDESLRFRDLLEYPMIRVAQRDERRVLVGTQGTLRRMLSQRIQAGGPTVALVQSSSAPIRLAFNFSKVRDLVSGFYEQSEPTIPEPMREDIANIIALTENVMIEVQRTSDEGLRISFGTSSEPNAAELMSCMDRLRAEGAKIARENLDVQLELDESLSDAMREAITSYSDRVQGFVETEKLWSVEGDRVQLHMENSIMANYSTIGVLTGLLLPAVQAAREAARRTASMNNMRQIVLSLFNYESANRKFPGRAVRNEDGEPLLSWRVMILPYLEENELFHEFRLDEPWDSEHNIQLLDRMPAIFLDPRQETPPGHTVFLAPYGENSGWPDESFRISQITDGTSNTISVVEAAAHLAVPWTKPDDLDVDQFQGDSWMPEGLGANVSMFDGSVRFLSRAIDFEVLRALFTMQGGEAVNVP